MILCFQVALKPLKRLFLKQSQDPTENGILVEAVRPDFTRCIAQPIEFKYRSMILAQ